MWRRGPVLTTFILTSKVCGNSLCYQQDSSRRDAAPPLPDIVRVSSLNILGVTVSSRPCAKCHHCSVRTDCVTQHYRWSTELSSSPGCCTYAASAWWDFTTAADRQRIEGFLRRGVRAGYRQADELTAAQLVEDSDDQLFHRVQYVSSHVLQPLLPDRRTNSYALRDWRHDFLNITLQNQFTDANFIIRQLFKDSY